MSIRPSDMATARQLVANLKSLVMDSGGGAGYRIYVDKVLKDISGLDKVATMTLASGNPVLSATRLIAHPLSRNLANILIGNDQYTLEAINELVLVAFQAAQIAMKPKGKITNEDVASYKYLKKLYAKGIGAIRENIGYSKSQKKFYKDQFSNLRDYVSDDYGRGRFMFDLDDDDDDDDDEEDDAYLDPGEDIVTGPTDVVTPKSYMNKGAAPMGASDVEEALGWAPGRIGAPRDEFQRACQEMAMNPHYNPREFAHLDYDFGGKASLQLIADRMGTIVEGIQLILNRLYGQEISPIQTSGDQLNDDSDVQDDEDDDELESYTAQEVVDRLKNGDFSDFSREELIAIWNDLEGKFGDAVNFHLPNRVKQPQDADGVVSATMTLGEDAADLDDDDDEEDDSESDDSGEQDSTPDIPDEAETTSDDSSEDSTSDEPDESPRPVTIADEFNASQGATSDEE